MPPASKGARVMASFPQGPASAVPESLDPASLDEATHAPFWQLWPDPQAVHTLPPVPQACAPVPVWHWPEPSQQPLQFDAAHCAPLHRTVAPNAASVARVNTARLTRVGFRNMASPVEFWVWRGAGGPYTHRPRSRPSDMRAILFRKHGDAGAMELADVPEPAVGAKDVRVRVKACALNHLDIWVREGWPGLK